MQPTSGQDPERGTDRRDAAENESPGSRAVPIGTSVRGLDRLNAKGSFDRGQSQARRYHARRRRGIAQRAGGRSNRRDPTCSKQRKGVALAARASQAQVAKIGRRGTGQQDGAHRLEDDADGGNLQRETSGRRRFGRRSLEISQTRGSN